MIFMQLGHEQAAWCRSREPDAPLARRVLYALRCPAYGQPGPDSPTGWKAGTLSPRICHTAVMEGVNMLDRYLKNP